MKRLKAAFGGLVDSKASESYLFWGTLVTSAACKFFPAFCEMANGLTQKALDVDFSVFVAGVLAYVMGRILSKGAKAELAPAK